jgi:hypothetical protein
LHAEHRVQKQPITEGTTPPNGKRNNNQPITEGTTPPNGQRNNNQPITEGITPSNGQRNNNMTLLVKIEGKRKKKLFKFIKISCVLYWSVGIWDYAVSPQT